MLVTPKKGTTCLTLTLIVDATVKVMGSRHNDHCALQITSHCHPGSLKAAKSERLATVARWRTACLMLGHTLVSHAEQVPQNIGCDAGHANQQRAVVEIVVGHVVNIGSGCEQSGAVIEANADHKRTRFSRMVS